MKINFDLLRDLLLAVESESTLDKGVLFFDHSERAAKIRSSLGVQSIPPLPPYQKDLELHYSLEEIFYHLDYCVEAKLLHPSIKNFSPNVYIPDLTVKGHEYINLIREKGHWNKIKSFLNELKIPLTVETLLTAGPQILNKILGL